MASYDYTFNSGDGVTPTRLNAARTISNIVNADIKSDAAISGTKIAPDFGSQNVVTTGAVSCGSNQVEHAAGFTPRLQVTGAGGAGVARFSSSTAPTLGFLRSKSNTIGTQSVVSSEDTLGAIQWRGSDGAQGILAAQISAQVDGTPSTNDMPGRLVFSTTADGASSPTERMRIGSNGDVSIATTGRFPMTSGSTEGFSYLADEKALYMSCAGGQCASLRRTTDNGTVVSFYRSNTNVGSIGVTTTATNFNTSSDYRLKENDTPLIGGLALIDQLRPVEFDWKELNEKGRGFIAHELQAVVPEAVTGEKDAVDAAGNPQYQGVDAA